jgi:hypothetical protein
VWHPPFRTVQDGAAWLRGEVPGGWLGARGMTEAELRAVLELRDRVDRGELPRDGGVE